MEDRLVLILVGGLIGFVSSLLTALLAHALSNRRLVTQLAREDELHRQEREREDRLRQEEREREDRARQQDRERDRLLREADMIWRDIERAEEVLRDLGDHDINTRTRFEHSIKEWQQRRRGLLERERRLGEGVAESKAASQ